MSSKVLKSIAPQIDSEDNDFVSIETEEAYAGSDEEISHSKLINDISLLSSSHKSFKWKATRFESKSDVNEFNLSQSKSLFINYFKCIHKYWSVFQAINKSQ